MRGDPPNDILPQNDYSSQEQLFFMTIILSQRERQAVSLQAHHLNIIDLG